MLHLFDSALLCVCLCKLYLSEKCSSFIYISGHQFDFGVISLVDEDLNGINGVKMAIKMPKGHLCTKKDAQWGLVYIYKYLMR